MSDAVQFLKALAQGIAAHRLYGSDHPRTGEAIDELTAHARALADSGDAMSFTFLDGDVIHGTVPLRERWLGEWGDRLSRAGVQRIELRRVPTAEEMTAFLGELQAGVDDEGRDGDEIGSDEVGAAIVWGAVRAPDGEIDAYRPRDPDSIDTVDLSEEMEAVAWIWARVEGGARLAIVEAEAVVRSLGVVLKDLPRNTTPRFSPAAGHPYDHAHAIHASLLTMVAARELDVGFRERNELGLAALLHDIGMTRIRSTEAPDAPDVISGHTTEGARLILEAEPEAILPAVVAFEHHRDLSGGGYPETDRIRVPHPAARLVRLLSAWDEFRLGRSDRPALSVEEARSMIRDGSGTIFDPVFARVLETLDRDTPAVAGPEA